MEAATQLAGSGLLASRYRFERELGRGAHGRVLLARDEAEGGAPRAVKWVDGAEAERLRWEFGQLCRLAHPNLAAVHELLRVEQPTAGFDMPAGSVALVADFAPGSPADRVAQALARDHDALLALALAVGEQVARALAAIHAHGLVHGDVKPSNIIVSDDRSRCTLVDLGLARPFDDSAAAGTPGYMAPELWRGERSPATDHYALGVTLVTLLRGAPAADTSVSGSTAAEHLSAALRPIAERVPLPAWVPDDLARLLAALTAPDADARPARAADIAARTAVIARTIGLGSSDIIGGGADDAPTPLERAQHMRTLPFAGDDDAVASLASALAEPGVYVVRGPRGAGRSRLVREAVRRLQADRVHTGVAVPTYRALDALPEVAVGHAVVHLGDADDVALTEAQAFVRAAEVDDSRVALVLERTEPLDAPTWELAPLDDVALATLLRHALGAKPPATLVREAAAVSGGLAGHLCRLLEHAAHEAIDLTHAGNLRALGGAATPSADTLPEDARELAELTAVAGGEIRGELAARCIDDAAQAARSLTSAGLARRLDDGRLVLRPDVVDALRSGLSATRVRALAKHLPERELDGRARAHLELARGNTAAAARHFESEIARRRQRGDAAGACTLAREALGLIDAPAEQARNTLALADALRACGRYKEGAEVLGDAAKGDAGLLAAELARLSGDAKRASTLADAVISAKPDAATATAAHTLRARIALDHGEPERALTLARKALEASDDAPGEPRAREVLALAHAAQGDAARAREELRLGFELARTRGDRAAEARLLSVLAQLARADGDLHGAAAHFTRAFELADAAGEAHAAASFLHNVGTQRLECGEPGPAVIALRDAARRLARLGRDADLGRVLYNLGYAAFLIGDDDVASAAAAQGIEAATRAGDEASAAFGRCLAGEIAERRGDQTHLAAQLEALGDAAQLGAHERALVGARRASLYLALDDREAAAAALADAGSAAEQAGDDAARVEHEVAAARLALATNEPTKAREHAERALALATRTGAFDARLRALAAAADTARAVGDAGALAARLTELRSVLDAAARTLAPRERAQLRGVAAYRPAFEALPGTEAPHVPASDERWRKLAALAKRLTAERRLSRLYDDILDAAIDLAGAERGFLVLRDAEGELRVRASRGLDRAQIDDSEGSPVSRSIVQRVIGSGHPLRTVDAASDERLTGAASVHTLSLRSVLAVPLKLGGDVAGVITLDDRMRPFAFGDSEVAVVSDLADLASIALDAAQRLRTERRTARRLAVAQRRLDKQLQAQTVELASLRRSAGKPAPSVAGIVASGESMQPVLRMIERVASADVPVLVRGESGTGKELVARAIHATGPRASAPFVSENCGAIPEPLLESALFGHVRGAFTGADRRRLGLFEIADGGTLFLDEIGEMTPAMQARLLRVLENGEVRPVGGERTKRVSVRVIAATHRDLEAMVKDGSFREDLYYRLSVVTITVPPLRDRPEDIAPLVAHFLDKHADGKRVSVERRALSQLAAYRWPGNVRQLENEVRRALVLADDVIGEQHLSPDLVQEPGDDVDELDLKGQVDRLERRLIRRALDTHGGNQTQAARTLGISRYGLQKMLRRLDL